ncbi:glycosyltransferase family 2 protein [Kineosporia mesophila]|uniref:Glycosyltransferase family 2 protein n=1 Tax=Kineosporia mesophila TaxID=566012 RepID=A0ABP7ABE1_9ACTN|nr:glycosyltransferase [Kineosporia mesophila]MCD5351354.1 glycosyltransferase [Kineosporia mesophila]
MAIDTTIVVPTYNESGNVPELVRQLREAFTGREAEILFVDDSTDLTPAVILEMQRQQVALSGSSSGTDDPGPTVRLIHREAGQRTGGLAGAVTIGIAAAEGNFVVVMDADLQHPPAMAPLLRDRVTTAGVDLVVASRYDGSGDASGLGSGWRHRVSGTSTLLSRALFPRRVGARCTDPMTGFFCLRRDAVDLTRLRPRGFKILLEILVSHDVSVYDQPFVFGHRLTGESKASWRNGLTFVHQLLSLRFNRAFRFAAVGALGLVVNLLIMAGLLGLGTDYVVASILATEATIVHNFVLQERFVFEPHLGTAPLRFTRRQRAWRSLVYNNLDALSRLPLLVGLVEVARLHSVVAQSLTLALSFVARFLFMAKFVYEPQVQIPVLARPATQAQPNLVDEGMAS